MAMEQTEYTTAGPEKRDEIIDFINYVFSQAHQPHDFKRMYPEIYADHWPQLRAKHFVALQNGHIRALVATHVESVRVLDGTLKVGHIGDVSVHPYARGEGHMKRLMADAMDDLRAQSCDLLSLNGLRHRYNHFGFEQAGWIFHYIVDQHSVRHGLGSLDVTGVALSELTMERPDEVDYGMALSGTGHDRQVFWDETHKMGQSCRLIQIDERRAGYVVGQGDVIALEREEDLPRVLKALFEVDGLECVTLDVKPWQQERMEILSSICAARSIVSGPMINVLNWRNTLEALLRLRGSFASLEDGCLTLAIDGQTVTIQVTDGAVSVVNSDARPDHALEHLKAQRQVFGMEMFALRGLYQNWFPLPI